MAEGSLTRPLYRNRFGIAYVFLSAIVGVAAGFFVLMLGDDGAQRSRWSAWQPTTDSSGDRVREIVDHVSARYRLRSGRELVAIFAQAGRLQNVRIEQIAVRKPVVLSKKDIRYVDASKSLVLQFCDLGDRCSLPAGDDASDRLRLLRNQALEVALYAFKYVDEVNSVVAFLPQVSKANPPKNATDAPAAALFFDRDALSTELERPLGATVPQPAAKLTPDAPDVVSATVDRLTLPRIYRYDLVRGDDGAILVLDPAAISG